MSYVSRALRLFRDNRSLWRYAIQPLIWSALIFLAVIVLTYIAIVPRVAGALAGVGLNENAASGVATIGFVLIWFFLSGVIYLALVALLSSFLWDKLSYEFEELAVGHAPQKTPPLREVLVDNGLRFGFTLGMALVGLCATVLLPGVGGLLIAGFVGLFDFTANAFLRRGITIFEQSHRVFKLKGWTGFVLAVGLLTIIPFVNVLMLPVMVGAGTLMVAESRAGVH